MALILKAKKQKKAKKVESPEGRLERKRQLTFANSYRFIFEKSGFTRISGVEGNHFEFSGIKSELDDIFIYENIVIFAEYTTSSGSNLGSHAKGNAGSHNAIMASPYKFLEALAEISLPVSELLKKIGYSKNQMIFKIIYCSDEGVEPHHQAFMQKTIFISLAEKMYFRKLVSCIKKSARYELFDFLGIVLSKVGLSGVINSTIKNDRYHGFILPEEHSNFPTGFKIASFYVDPEAILKRAYVLRQGAWRDSLNLYQRMIIPAKIRSIRKYLRSEQRVFTNNIVVTLPDDTEFRSVDNKIVDSTKISEITPAWVSINDVPNSIGIVDGQHRVFSYFEDLEPDDIIDKYRRQQSLIATGIVYPANTSKIAKEQFEAALFLEINSNQSGASSDLKQSIWLILDPARPISVARKIVNSLAATTPLAGILEKSAYDIGRIRTTTIATYGVQPLVKRSGKDSIFYIWKDPDKAKIADGGKDLVVLDRYLNFSVEHISDFLSLIRKSLDVKKWKIADRQNDGVLSVTTINSFLILMRKLIESGYITETDILVDFAKLNHIDVNKFKSSQYAALAAKMYDAVTK